MNRAFSQITGFEDGFKGISMMGRTDPLILKDVLEKHGLSWDQDDIEIFRQVYYGLLKEEMAAVDTAKVLCPGIADLLYILNQETGMTLGLLTGNWEQGARLKLRHFNIDPYFKLGAYADDESEREKLVPVAMNRYESLSGRSIPHKYVYVIGDTPLDIIAARPHGVRTVGVATGFHDIESIRRESPDMLFENFEDVERVAAYFREE
jgi:phosphoglycolate phosphatase